ncbi:MAG TPA: TIM barrel protein [Planctomycetota bacterium]|nr:TIM barrel protein [Planctomycetota bacterium]
MTNGRLTRRELLLATGGGALAASLPLASLAADEPAAKLKGRIHQSASKWCYGGIPLPELCAFGKKIGLEALDLLGPGDFKTLKEHGLACSMVSCNSIGKGFNRTENHEGLIKNLRPAIEATSAAGFPNVICFSGNCQGMPKDEGLKNCAEGLKKIVGFAEEKKVVLCIEYLNSKNHRDYMADDSKWCFDLIKAVGSPSFKILYDIYHVAMMEAQIVEEGGKKVAKHNICQLIKDNIDAIGHFHTGGFPGRNEIDDTQLLDYPAIMRAIAEAGYKGYVAHEFVPKNKNKLESLAQAVKICDV